MTLDTLESTATICMHTPRAIKFEVINQTRGELLELRNILEATPNAGTVLILLPNNQTL